MAFWPRYNNINRKTLYSYTTDICCEDMVHIAVYIFVQSPQPFYHTAIRMIFSPKSGEKAKRNPFSTICWCGVCCTLQIIYIIDSKLTLYQLQIIVIIINCVLTAIKSLSIYISLRNRKIEGEYRKKKCQRIWCPLTVE